MSVIDNKIVCTSEYFPMFDQMGARWLAFRDIPYLISKYVNGVVALDYGCGTGTSTMVLKSCGLNTDAVDINETILEIAKNSDPAGKYTLIKSGEIPEDNEHYDVVLVSLVLMYISTKTEMQQILQEISRCLKVNGVFIAVVLNKYTYKYEWSTVDGRFEENKNMNSGDIVRFKHKKKQCIIHNYFWSKDDYCEVISIAGLSLVCVHCPLGKDSDGFEWISEKEKPFVDIYVAKKLCNK